LPILPGTGQQYVESVHESLFFGKGAVVMPIS